jgi:tRNA(Arg) A34 adenosine deaminase TadA
VRERERARERERERERARERAKETWAIRYIAERKEITKGARCYTTLNPCIFYIFQQLIIFID